MSFISAHILEYVCWGGGKHKHMRLEHLLRSWSNPVAQINVCGGVTSASGASLASGVAQIASDGCTDLWGWLYAPRVSCGPCCMHPVCLVRVAVWPTCVLCGWFYAPLVFFCIGQPQKAHGVQTQGRVQRHSCAHTVCKIGCLCGAGPRGARPVSVSQFCSVIVSKHI